MKNNSLKLIIVVFLIMIFSLTGCETVRKKFTRPPKEKPKAAIALTEETAAQTYPNSILYQSHYVLWKCWQDELVNSLGGNHKKETESASGALSELKSMKNLLNSEGQAAIEPYALELEGLVRRVEKDDLSFSTLKQLKNDISQNKTRVEKNFHYRKISNWIKPDQPLDAGK